MEAAPDDEEAAVAEPQRPPAEAVEEQPTEVVVADVPAADDRKPDAPGRAQSSSDAMASGPGAEAAPTDAPVQSQPESNAVATPSDSGNIAPEAAVPIPAVPAGIETRGSSFMSV